MNSPRSVLIVDQENEANIGGQAFWSFGGLFFVDSAEQRRVGIRDSCERALEAASLQTLNDGIMTKDLCGLAEGITPTAVDSEGFIKAIRTRLEAKLA